MKWTRLKLSFLLLTWAMLMNGCQPDSQLGAEDCFAHGLVAEKAEDYANAINAYTKALEINPHFAKAYRHRGMAWSNINMNEAMVDFTNAIKLDSRYADAFNNRGVILDKKGNYDQAIDDFTKALEIDSYYAAAYYNRGITWFDKGNPQQALTDVRKALKLKPENQKNKEAESLLETRIKNFKIE